MLRTRIDQPTLWESVLPPELLRMPVELARVDALLDDERCFAPFRAYFDLTFGRPSIPVETYLRLMFLKVRYRLGYESLCAEVTDSIGWRLFCRIGIDWTHPEDPALLRGERRYQALVRMCRDNGVLTPEDKYPVWSGTDGPATMAPLFLLYDYSFRVPGTNTKQESPCRAYESGVVCADERLLHPDPYPYRESQCWERIAYTGRRLAGIDPTPPTVLVSHWPLLREPTAVLWYPEFAQWCGTERTANWHLRFRATVAVYGRLHIPRTTHHDGVRFEEVSLGYPREWAQRGDEPQPMRRTLGAHG